MSQLMCGIDNDFSKPIATGEGTAVVVSGWVYHLHRKIRTVHVLVGTSRFEADSVGEPRLDVLNDQVERVGPTSVNSLNSGFWTIIVLPKCESECELSVALQVKLDNGEVHEIGLGSLKLRPFRRMPMAIAPLVTDQDGALVAICMATYNPKLSLFERQVRSLQSQSYENWICIILDDGSNQQVFSRMKEIVVEDPRFYVLQNETNLGFYHNFERCLSLVPVEADFVSLCDQDDEWFPDKLSKTLSAFNDETMLAYSDMNLVDESDNVMSKTYWNNRENNYTDLEFLLLANTVTGAASVFRADLLSRALPFPQKIGDSFHDWWLALCAMMAGNITYVNEPLYNYTQHDGNVIGHSEKTDLLDKIRLGDFLRVDRAKLELKRILHGGLAVLRHDYKRIVLAANAINVRFDEGAYQKLRVIRRHTHMRSAIWLAGLAAKGKLLGRDTMHAELRLLNAVVARRVLHLFYERRKALYAGRVGTTVQVTRASSPDIAPMITVEPLLGKISPLKLVVCDEPHRVNIVIPSIDFKYFFGGYLGKFNLAKRLTEYGYHVRMLIVDYCEYNLSEWRRSIKEYHGLEDIFDIVEFQYVFDRDQEVRVSSKDIFFATTWWTAYIANDARKKLGTEAFLYLVQEYEPLTFPHGAYYALAAATYDFPHFAIYSTELLQKFFRSSKIGVYKDVSTLAGDERSVSFQNAILSFSVDSDDMNNRGTKKLLFYARPESHASRNMFEVGVMALIKAIETGAFSDCTWEFYGMGTVGQYNSIKLTDGIRMKLLPKMSLDEYKSLLPQFDLGLSLMLTPHPSLVPLEMAAAGMIVVTNSYATKSAEELERLSTNILVAGPTIDGVHSALTEAAHGVHDISNRVAGAKVRWSSSWTQSFDTEFFKQLSGFIESCR